MPKFNVVVKNGDSKYEINPETGKYDFKITDYVGEYDNLLGALKDCLEWSEDDGSFEETVKLVYSPKKGGD